MSKRPCLISVTCLFSDANKQVENRLKNIDLLQNGATLYFNENDSHSSLNHIRHNC